MDLIPFRNNQQTPFGADCGLRRVAWATIGAISATVTSRRRLELSGLGLSSTAREAARLAGAPADAS
jgi:hypothetical protein